MTMRLKVNKTASENVFRYNKGRRLNPATFIVWC